MRRKALHWGYFSAGLIAGLAGCFALIFSQLDRLSGQTRAFEIPGETIMDLESGDWSVMHWVPDEHQGRYYDNSGFPGLMLSVEGPSGEDVDVDTGGGGYMRLGNKRGTTIFAFEAKDAGSYKVVSEYAGGDGPPGLLRLSQSFTMSLILVILAGVALALGGAGLGVWLGLRAKAT